MNEIGFAAAMVGVAIITRRHIPIVVVDNIIIVVVVELLVLDDAREPVGIGSQHVREPPQLVPLLFLLRFFSLITLPCPRCLPALPVVVDIVHRCVVV